MFVLLPSCHFVTKTGDHGSQAIKSNPRAPGDHEAGSRNRCLCLILGFIEDGPLDLMAPCFIPSKYKSKMLRETLF